MKKKNNQSCENKTQTELKQQNQYYQTQDGCCCKSITIFLRQTQNDTNDFRVPITIF